LQNGKLFAAYDDANGKISRRGKDNAPFHEGVDVEQRPFVAVASERAKGVLKDKLAEFGGVNDFFSWR
jgi:hypothetical protein